MKITTKNEKIMDTNDNEKKDVLGKYTRKPYPPLVEPEQPDTNEDDEQKYRALIEHREKKGNAPRFRIIDRTGQSYGCGYAYLLGWLYSPPDTLSIYTTTHIFIINGTGLNKIDDSLMRERVKQLREYNPPLDEMPPNNEPLITKITISNRFESN